MEACFIWQEGCINGDQYAAWAQAIGGLIGIGIAIGVPWRQEIVRARERQSEQLHARQNQLVEIITMAETMADVAQIFAGQPNVGQPAAVERAAGAVVRMRQIKTDQLSTREYKKFRDLMNEASDFLTQANHGSAASQAPAYAESFRDYANDFQIIFDR